jgi:hypothetical protein
LREADAFELAGDYATRSSVVRDEKSELQARGTAVDGQDAGHV